MKKLSFVLAAATLAMLSSGAFADGPIRLAPVRTPVPGSTGPGDNRQCTALCSPDTPTPPNDPGNPNSPGNPANPNSAANQPFKLCGDRLSQLRRVAPAEVTSLTLSEKIKVQPICEGHTASLTAVQVKLLDRGNVQGLAPVIDGNPILTAKLSHGNYKANDVIGIVVNGPSAVLYVHHQ